MYSVVQDVSSAYVFSFCSNRGIRDLCQYKGPRIIVMKLLYWAMPFLLSSFNDTILKTLFGGHPVLGVTILRSAVHLPRQGMTLILIVFIYHYIR